MHDKGDKILYTHLYYSHQQKQPDNDPPRIEHSYCQARYILNDMAQACQFTMFLIFESRLIQKISGFQFPVKKPCT